MKLYQEKWVKFTEVRKELFFNQTGLRIVTKLSDYSGSFHPLSVNDKKVFIGYAGTPEAAARLYDQYVIDHNLNHTRNFSD